MIKQPFRCALVLTVVAWILCSAAPLLYNAQSVAQEPTWTPSRTPLTSRQTALTSSLGSSQSSATANLVSQSQLTSASCGEQCVVGAPHFAPSVVLSSMHRSPYDVAPWQLHVLPSGVMWQSYWAGANEPRIAGVAAGVDDGTGLLDVTLGGRASILRYGTAGVSQPEGWELQIEGAAFPRLNLSENWDVDATDFRFGIPVVYGRDRIQWKFAYYHLSAHMGDELAIREGRLSERINFSRDALVVGVTFRPLPSWRWYAEAGWAFAFDDGSEPWEFQFGVDVAEPGPTGVAGTPFFAINGHLREEVEFGGNLVVQTGWLWRGQDNHALRFGLHYYNGKSNQFEFFNTFEQQIGLGIWYDF